MADHDVRRMGIVKLADLLNRGKLNIQLLFCETENRIPKAEYQLKNTVLEANVKIEFGRFVWRCFRQNWLSASIRGHWFQASSIGPEKYTASSR